MINEGTVLASDDSLKPTHFNNETTLKRKHWEPNDKKELFVDSADPKKMKGLDSMPSYQVGDQVEAIKSGVEEWYCARVVDVMYDKNLVSVFIHYEGWPPDEADWISPDLIRLHLPRTSFQYGPKGAESNRSWKDYAEFYKSLTGKQTRNHTGLVQDRRMMLHNCPCQQSFHPEKPDRMRSILQALHTNRLLRYFGRVRAREITPQELQRVHTYTHVRNYYPLNEERPQPPTKITSIAAVLNPEPVMIRGLTGDLVRELDKETIKHRFPNTVTRHPPPPGLICEMTCGELGIAVDTTFHPFYTSLSARIAAGALLSLVDPIVHGQLTNGFALIRPPGHHAETDVATGFCFYNNVAVAVADTLEKYPEKIKKILIIDWDIHHGNGTQKAFYDNPHVLYISIHRWDKGTFYPFSGKPEDCGEGPGLGTNVNIAFSPSLEKPKPMGDTEFAAAFYYFVMPIAKQFCPDMIFVSAGFDAAEGHPENLGGYNVTPRGFAVMTKMVKDLADEMCQGRLVLCLEGGYELHPLATCCAASVAQLLPPKTVSDQQLSSLRRTLNAVKPNQGAVESFAQVARIQKEHWTLSENLLAPNYKFNLPSDWRATDSISTRPRRDKKPIKLPVVEGY